MQITRKGAAATYGLRVARRRYRHDRAFRTDVKAGGMGMDSGQWRLTPRLGMVRYPAPYDYILRRSCPLFRAREVLEYLALGGDAAPGVTAPLAATPD
jgi:hypothetical protein